jgi:hypothetical protein
LNETIVWLQIIWRSKMISPNECSELENACIGLCRIIGASVRTAFKNQTKNNN